MQESPRDRRNQETTPTVELLCMKATHDRSLTVELLLQNCMTSLSFCYLLDMIAAILLSSYTCYCIAIGSARKVILLELYHFNSIYFVAGARSDQVSIQISSPWVLLFRYMRCEGLFFRTFTIFLVILYSTDRDERICQCSCYDYCTSPVIWTCDLGSKIHMWPSQYSLNNSPFSASCRSYLCLLASERIDIIYEALILFLLQGLASESLQTLVQSYFYCLVCLAYPYRYCYPSLVHILLATADLLYYKIKQQSLTVGML